MANYRAYLIGRDGQFFRAITLDSADDSDATELAKRLVNDHDVELWQGDRKIARFENKLEKTSRSITNEIRAGRLISNPAE
jgi:hypothetical protein